MLISASFFKGEIPETGLTPTIKIWDIGSETLVIDDVEMDEILSSGKYKYDFPSFNPKKSYIFECDGNDSTLDNRFTEGSNECFVDDIRDEIKNKKTLTKDSDTQYTELLYEDDGVTVIRNHRLTKDGDTETREPI